MQQNQDAQAEQDLLCEYEDHSHEELCQAMLELHVDAHPSLSRQKDPDPNEASRLSMRIFENFLMKSVRTMHQFLIGYLHHLLEKNQERTPEEDNLIQELSQYAKPVEAVQITPTTSIGERQAMLLAVNKLKTMVIKVFYKESSNLSYMTDTYISKLKQTLEAQVRFKQNRLEKTSFVELAVAKHELVQLALRMVRQRFDVVGIEELHVFKKKPKNYLSKLKEGLEKAERPVLFVKWLTEQLLWINTTYTGFSQQLLFCPLVLDHSQSITISPQYMEVLSQTYSQWSQIQVYVEAFHNETSTVNPIFYGKLLESFDQPQRDYFEFPQGTRRQLENIEQMMTKIASIRKCTFAGMIALWLSTIFEQPPQQAVELEIHSKFRVRIRCISERSHYEGADLGEQTPIFKRQLINSLMSNVSRRNIHERKTRQQLKREILNSLRATTLKLVSEQVGSRITWPLECGSLGEHCYQANKDKLATKAQVRKIFDKF